MAFEDVFQIITYIFCTIGLILPIAFIISYLRTRDTSTTGIMTLILNIYILLCPLNILNMYIIKPEENINDIFYAINFGCYEFSVVWTTNFAVFTYILTKNMGNYFNEARFLRNSLIVCFSFSLIIFLIAYYKPLGLIVYRDEFGITKHRYPLHEPLNQTIIFLIFEVFGRIIPALINFFCYFGVYRLIKHHILGVRKSRSNMTRLTIMAILPIVCFIPMSIINLIYVCLGQQTPLELQCLKSVLGWIFFDVNLLNYWFFIPKTRSETLLGRSVKSIDDEELRSEL